MGTKKIYIVIIAVVFIGAVAVMLMKPPTAIAPPGDRTGVPVLVGTEADQPAPFPPDDGSDRTSSILAGLDRIDAGDVTAEFKEADSDLKGL